MRAIIIGCGRVGSTVAKRLASEGWHVTAIDVLTEAVRSCEVPRERQEVVR